MTNQKGVDPDLIWQKYEEGVTQKRIAADLNISRNTVVYHLRQLRKKKKGAKPRQADSQTSSSTEASNNAVVHGIVSHEASSSAAETAK